MQALLGYNRKLAWVVVPTVIWACLGLSLALGAGRGGPPPFAMHLGLPEGGVIVPGRILLVEETESHLHLTSGVPDRRLEDMLQWESHLPFDLPDNLVVDFTGIDFSQPGMTSRTEFRLLDPANQPRRFAGQREVVLTKHYIVVLKPHEARLLPRGRDSEQLLQRLLNAKPGAGDTPGNRQRQHNQMDGPGQPPHERLNPRKGNGLGQTGELGAPPAGAPPQGQPPFPPEATPPKPDQPPGGPEALPPAQPTDPGAPPPAPPGP